MKKILKTIDKNIDRLEKVMDKENDAILLIVGGKTTGDVNSSMIGVGETLASIIYSAIEGDEELRLIMMTAIFQWRVNNQPSIEKTLIQENNGSVN